MVLIMTNILNGIVYIRPLFDFYVQIINKLLTYLKHRFQSIIIISIVSAITRVVCVVLTAALCRTLGAIASVHRQLILSLITICRGRRPFQLLIRV